MKKSFNFKEFYELYKELYPSNPQPSQEFLEWFIGFSEGEACFSVASRGDLSFIVTQSTNDVQILYYILNNLGFGSVIVQSKIQKTHRFVVQDIKNIQLICLLFNGNIVLPWRSAKFLIFLANVNAKLLQKNKPLIQPQLTTRLPSLEDNWLAGFTDGEGCFTASLLNSNTSNSAFRFRFILTQKHEVNKPVLEFILNLFLFLSKKDKGVGAVVPHSVKDVFELRINGLSNCEYIFGYFDKYSLKTKKKESYEKWKIVHSLLKNKHHLDVLKKPILLDLIKKIN